MVVTDATQLPGRSPCDLPTLGADLVLFGQRGPAGTAGPVAVIAAGQDLLPDSFEVAGEPPADAVQALTDGLVAAIETEAPEAWRLAALRDRFETTVIARVSGVETLGASVPRLPNTTLLRFIGVDSDTLAKLMPALVGYGVGEGLGSERAGARRLNYVLEALGLREDQTYGCVTFSLHPGTSEGDVDVAVGALVDAVPLARYETLGGDHGE
jgi:cysteine desulfurase